MVTEWLRNTTYTWTLLVVLPDCKSDCLDDYSRRVVTRQSRLTATDELSVKSKRIQVSA